ncbi:MAG: hypothetical protein JRJ46_09980 [Deltaproteobacteria bacterium]|nr:hypothetical protein [Deltaproteobacteria bacterium]
MNCKSCIHYSGRLVIDGKLTWGSFCTLPAYHDDLPAVEILEGHTCPLKKEPEK